VRLALIPYLLGAAAVGLLRQLGHERQRSVRSGLDPWLITLYAVAWLAVLAAPGIGWVTFRFCVIESEISSHAFINPPSPFLQCFSLGRRWHIAGTTLQY